MKIDKVYMFQNEANKDFGKLIVLYEMEDKTECDDILKLVDERNNRHTCFMSDGLYYVGEYVTEQVAKFLIASNKMHDISHIKNLDHTIDWHNTDMFWVDQQAYGDWYYYFDNNTKQFYREYISIGD